MEIDHLSFSSVSLYAGTDTIPGCPHAFKMKMEGNKQPTSSIMQAGKGAHSDFEQWAKAGMLGECESIGKRLANFFRTVFKGVRSEDVETEFDMDMWTTRYVGRKDIRIKRGEIMVIADLKGWPSDWCSPDQLKDYCMDEMTNDPALELFQCYFAYRGPDYYSSYTWTKEEIEEHFNERSSVIERIMSDTEFEPVPSNRCKRCGYLSDCPAAVKFSLTTVPQVTSVADCIELSRQLFPVKAKVDEIEDAIKQFMLENCIDELPITDTDRYYLKVVSPSISTGKIKTKEQKDKANRILSLVGMKEIEAK